MALIKCPECGKEISDTCEQCIHCGYKLRNVRDGYLTQKPQNLNISNTTEHIKQESEYRSAIVGCYALIGTVWFVTITFVILLATLVTDYPAWLIPFPFGIFLTIVIVPFIINNKKMLKKYYD